MAFLMRIVLIILIFFAGITHSQARERLPQFRYNPTQFNILKLSPSMFGVRVKGLSAKYETGLWYPRLSTQLSVEYFGRILAEETRLNQDVEDFYRAELQLRFYPNGAFDGFFISPLFNIDNHQNLGGGFVLGYQYFMAKFLSLEGYFGIQNRTDAFPFFESSLIPRYGWSINIAF